MEDLTTKERKRALDDYDAKILDLVRKTQVAISKRNALVPACFLLPELLLTIFVHVVEDWFYASHLIAGEPRDRITDGYFPPRRLDWRPSVLHVCRRWREVATSTSLLWQYVILDELEPLLFESLEKTNSLPKWARTHSYSFQLNNQEVLRGIQGRQVQHLSLLRNSFASLEILQLDLYSIHAVKTLLQIEETFPLVKDFDLKLIYGSYFSSEEMEEYHEVITRLPLFILQMPNVRFLWLTVPWTVELTSLPPHISSVWIDAGLRKWLIGSLPPASILSPALWNSLERLRHLTIGRNYIGIASETTQLALPCLQRLHILDAGAEELVAFLDVVSIPHSKFVQLDEVTIGHADHLPPLKRTIKRLTAPSDDQLSSKIEWNLSGPPESRSNIMNLYRGRELSDPSSSLPFSGFSISFRYSNGLEVSEILGALLHGDLRFALLSFDLEGADLEVTNSVLGVTRSISDALKGPSDLAVETFFRLNDPQKQSWEIHRSPIDCFISLTIPGEDQSLLKDFCIALQGDILTGFSIQSRPCPYFEASVIVPIFLSFSHQDWVALLAYSNTVRHISFGSLLEVNPLVKPLALSHPDDGLPLFRGLKDLTFTNVAFRDEEDSLLSVLKWRKDNGFGLVSLKLSMCFGIDESTMEALESVVEDVTVENPPKDPV